MIRINENYSKLQASYLFSDIAKRVAAFQKELTESGVSNTLLESRGADIEAGCGQLRSRRLAKQI